MTRRKPTIEPSLNSHGKAEALSIIINQEKNLLKLQKKFIDGRTVQSHVLK